MVPETAVVAAAVAETDVVIVKTVLVMVSKRFGLSILRSPAQLGLTVHSSQVQLPP